MFSPQIVSSDAFLDMPTSSRELYFQLGMFADDDGFINPKRIIRMVGASEDDLKILISKRFVLPFDNGVVVIKHWRVNNLVRKDWYRPTQYIEEKRTIYLKENGSYTQDSTQGAPIVNELVNSSSPQVRLGKVINTEPKGSILTTNSKNMRTYNEDNHSDSDLPAVDLDTGQVIVKEKTKKEPKNKTALALQRYFILKAQKETGIKPVEAVSGYYLILSAMKKAELDGPKLKSKIDDWFSSGLPTDQLIQITRCFSDVSMNTWKANNQ